MTPEKTLEVLNLHYRTLEHYPEQQLPDTLINPSREQLLGHCKWMISQARVFVSEGRMDKAFRWLGFIQCGLFAGEIYNIALLKEINRPQ